MINHYIKIKRFFVDTAVYSDSLSLYSHTGDCYVIRFKDNKTLIYNNIKKMKYSKT